ncbi:hypothetical protein BDZ97DRAFT_1101449 [Flammula alnicola]|nr:hypothetical protein BDZ97DRAFT_1101449 [Flammula alnicola]
MAQSHSCQRCRAHRGLCNSLHDHNYDPTQCALFCGRTCDACSQIARLDAEITQMEDQLADLARRRLSLKEKANLYHDPVTRNIPLEITTKIFISYIDSVMGPEIFSTNRSREQVAAPLRLAGICKTWREIALATPQLWTTMDIKLGEAQFCKQYGELTRQWLDRSGQQLLSVCLLSDTEPDGYYPWTADGLPPWRDGLPYFEIIKDHAHRWQHLGLCMDPIYYPAFFDDFPETPSLRTLKILAPRRHSPGAPLFRFRETPCLRNVEIFGASQIDISWHTVTHFKATKISVDVALEVLRHATHLTHCELHELGSAEGFSANPIKISSYSLQYLYFAVGHPNAICIFDRILLPSLQRLVYRSPYSYDAPVLHPTHVSYSRGPFLRPLFGVQEFLTHLTLELEEEAYTIGNPIVAFLVRLPTVTYLSLSSSKSGKEMSHTEPFPLLQHLALRSTAESSEPGETFLPQLEVLKFSARRTFSWGSFLNIFHPDASTAHIPGSDGTSFLPNAVTDSLNGSSPLSARGRPLHHVYIGFLFGNVVTYIDKEFLLRLLQIKRSEIHLEIIDEREQSTATDLLEASLKFHGMV